ncbi:hypothetical protein [Adhaeribacter aquaticus]|uniref:hypothetical protein n=1 Tax=Adhaeribacter aquaticus TaxID=299567 RepID=UPI00042560B9|nr:hypothetical protein [Adhaeribacter aquaticus]
MTIKNILSYFLLSLTLVVSACGDKNDQEATVTPAAELSLNHFFAYHDGNPKTKTQAPSELKAEALKSETEFYFYSGNQNQIGRDATGDDHISFKIPVANLKSDYIGKYNLKSLPEPANGQASVYYVHYANASGGSMFDSRWNTLEGLYEIKSYDAKHQLVSGEYTLTMKQVGDPYTADQGFPDRKKVDITVSGTFKNVRVN